MTFTNEIEIIVRNYAKKLGLNPNACFNYLAKLLDKDYTCQEYTLFYFKKKSGGRRQITAPSCDLLNIQECFKLYLSERYVPNDSANGFINGKSILTNAQAHVRKNYVFNIDIKNFFGTINSEDIIDALIEEPFNMVYDDAKVFAFICTYSYPEKDEYNEFNIVDELPQGAPTSPILSNIVFDVIDRKLTVLANQYRLTYTRYADDITFSSNLNKYQENGKFRIKLSEIFDQSKFHLNSKKTRLQGYWQQQIVTGLVVNDGVNVKRKLIREIRAILYIWETYGINDAMRSFNKCHRHNHRDYAIPYFLRVIYGKIMFIKMIRGEYDELVSGFICKFHELSRMSFDCTLEFQNKSCYYEKQFVLATDEIYYLPSHSKIVTTK